MTVCPSRDGSAPVSGAVGIRWPARRGLRIAGGGPFEAREIPIVAIVPFFPAQGTDGMWPSGGPERQKLRQDAEVRAIVVQSMPGGISAKTIRSYHLQEPFCGTMARQLGQRCRNHAYPLAYECLTRAGRDPSVMSAYKVSIWEQGNDLRHVQIHGCMAMGESSAVRVRSARLCY